MTDGIIRDKKKVDFEKAWYTPEPEPLIDELEFSSWAKRLFKPGQYMSWNIMSPEQWFCEYVGSVAAALPEGSIIVESGVGQGYVTRASIRACMEKDGGGTKTL